MGRSLIQLSESTIGSIAQTEGTIAISFSPAHVLKSEGIPGVDASTQWTQSAQLTFQEAQIVGELPALPAAIASGRITVNNMGYVDMIPAPLESAGLIRLSLEITESVAKVMITGTEVKLELQGYGKYIQHIPPP